MPDTVLGTGNATGNKTHTTCVPGAHEKTVKWGAGEDGRVGSLKKTAREGALKEDIYTEN